MTIETLKISPLVSTAAILGSYNELAEALGEKTVARFADRKTAERRYAEIVGRANGSVATTEAAPVEPPPATTGATRIARGAEVKQLRRSKPAVAKARAPREPGTAKTPAGKRTFYFKRALSSTGLREPRPGTKRARVLELLLRKEGASHAEVMADIGWDARTAYEGMRLISIEHGYGLDHDQETNRVHAYADKADSWEA